MKLVYTNSDGKTFKVAMICNSDIGVNASVIGALTTDGNGNYETTLEGDLGCDVWSMSAFFEFVQDYRILFGIILMVLGVPFCLMGRKFFSVIVFIVGVLITVSLIMLLFYSTFLDSNTEAWVFWLVLSLSIVAGLAVGFVLFKCQKLGAACVAGWGGFLGGLVINTTFLFVTNQEWLFWVVSIGCAIAAAICAFLFYFPVIITVTSFAGAYMFVRGISLFIPGSYPNEFTLIEELKEGYVDNIPYWFYLYLGFMIIFTIVGMVVQCKHLKKEKEEHGEENIHHPYADRY